MNSPDMALEIKTLGSFVVSVNGRAVATEWPDEAVKVLFCSLLSPLDLYFTWDRIIRAMLDVPDSVSSRQKLVKTLLRPLNSFLIGELGFNPFITGDEGIRIDQQRLSVDAFEFREAAVEGLRLVSFGNHTAAFEKLCSASSIHSGIYLPDIPGKIISSTRRELESLYQAAVMATITLKQISPASCKVVTDLPAVRNYLNS